MSGVYRGKPIEEAGATSVRLVESASIDYNTLNAEGTGYVTNTVRWLSPDEFQISSSFETDKGSGEEYYKESFLVPPLYFTGSFFGEFGGTSAYISGSLTAIGSSSFYGPVTISGSTTHDGYIRLNPVTTNIDSSVSASYIYVSGSTNDLYFTQNGEGYSNTTRLRWLEGNLYTGLLYGGRITSASSTTFNISSGSGIIVNLNASVAHEPYPTVQYINWPNLTNQSLTYLNFAIQTFVGIDSSGSIIQQTDPWSDGQYNTSISIGTILHQNLLSINGFISYPNVAYGYKQRTYDFIKAFGPLKLSGYPIYTSGSLGLTVGSGSAFADGRNYQTDPNNPSYIIDPGTSVSKIFRYYVSASTYNQDTNAGAGYTEIDPSQYNNNGVLTSISPSTPWTNQRVFWYPNSVTKAVVVYYGSAVYASDTEAIANLPYEAFFETPNTQQNAVYLGAITIKYNGTFATAADYRILPAGIFRNVGGSGGGTSIPAGGSTTPGGSNTQIQYNNSSTFGGSPNFTFISSSNTVFITGSLTVSGSSTFTNIGPAAFNGNTSMTGSLFVSSSNATQLQVGSNLLFVSSSGNVGIGTNAPTALLHVKSGGSNGIIRIASPTTTLGFTLESENSSNAAYVWNQPNAGMYFGTNNTARMFITAGGNVGVGTTSPTSQLQVKGSGATSATTALRVENTNASASLVVLDDGSVGVGTSTITAKLDVRINQANTSTVSYLNLLNDAAGYVGYTFKKVGSNDLGLYGNYTTPPSMLWKYVDGVSSYVGINTASPAASLHISGASSQGLLKIDSPTVNNILYVSGSGNVGISTNTSAYRLQIDASGSSNSSLPLALTSIDANNRVGILFASSSISSGKQHRLWHRVNTPTVEWLLGASAGETAIWRFIPRDDTNYSVNILTSYNGGTAYITTGLSQSLFSLGAGSQTAQHINISSSGNVGIGTNTPSTALEVNGVIRTSQMSIGGLDSGRNQFLTYTAGPVYRMFSTLGSYASLGVGSFSVGSTYGGISGSVNTVLIEGNTSIGTTTQSARLHVQGSGATSATTALRVENSNTSASLVVRDDGYVGVGTTSPSHLLSLGTGSIAMVDSYPIRWGTSNLLYGSVVGLDIASSAFAVRFRFTTGGNLLIGTTTDSGYKLNVSGSGNFTNGLTVTGSVIATSFTGSLLGTASYATTVLAAGPSNAVQYNNGGVLGGTSKFTFDGTTFSVTNRALITGSLIVSGTYGGINTVSNKPNLFDASGISRVSWTNGLLNNAANNTTLNWELNQLNDSATTAVVDWENKMLYDAGGSPSIDWSSRTLSEGTGTWVALDYSGDTFLNSQLYYLNVIPPQVQRAVANGPLYGGQIIEGTTDASVTDFQLVYLETDGIWYATKAGVAYGAAKMLGICVSQTNGQILIEGDVGVSDDNSQGAYVIGADHGLPVYVSATTGVMTVTAPSGTGELVRIVGHIYYQSTTDTNWWTMKFRPSNDWYVL